MFQSSKRVCIAELPQKFIINANHTRADVYLYFFVSIANYSHPGTAWGLAHSPHFHAAFMGKVPIQMLRRIIHGHASIRSSSIMTYAFRFFKKG